MNKILIGVIVVLLVILGIFIYTQKNMSTYQASPQDTSHGRDENDVLPVENDGGIGDGAPPLDELLAAEGQTQEVIGKSVKGRDIVAYHYGNGDKEVLLVGGIHGGYSWNTALLAQQMRDYFADAGAQKIPENVRVTIIPVLNPDGLDRVVDIDANEDFKPSDVQGSTAQMVAARFNAHRVDLNRNFDCNWKRQGVWRSQKVSGGTAPFSEPESKAILAYVEKSKPDAAIVFYSSAGAVYASQCDGVTPKQTLTLTDKYAEASGYPAHKTFDAYEVNGDMVNWLAKKGIPAISVLLTDKKNTELSKNLRGVDAVLNYIAQ